MTGIKQLLINYRKELEKIQIKNGFTDEQMESYRIGFMDAIIQYEQRKSADAQPVKRGHWIEKSEEYYRLWQDSGRSWEDMPYFVTGLKFACPCCFNQYGVDKEGVEEWDFCPKCGADMRGDTKC